MTPGWLIANQREVRRRNTKPWHLHTCSKTDFTYLYIKKVKLERIGDIYVSYNYICLKNYNTITPKNTYEYSIIILVCTVDSRHICEFSEAFIKLLKSLISIQYYWAPGEIIEIFETVVCVCVCVLSYINTVIGLCMTMISHGNVLV